VHFLPVHELTWYRGRFRADCPVAERAGRELLSLPLSPAHPDDDIAYVAETLAALHQRFTA
jgi:dTDP-4-amino-4,6-dideoxygalactose transaminase